MGEHSENTDSLSLLLIEDNPGDARLIQEMLRESLKGEYSLVAEERLESGIRVLQEEHPDLVLLDLGLPDADGIDAVRQVVQADGTHPIVVLTGLDDEETALAALREGCQDYLVKDRITGPVLERTIRYSVERMRTKRELRESEQRFRLLAEHIEEVFYLWDVRSEPPQIVYLSSSAEKLSGRPVEDFLEDPNVFVEMIHPEDRDRAVEELPARLRGETDSHHRIVRPDGEVRWIHDQTYPVTDEDGELRYAAGIARDVTEEVKLRRKLERERAGFQEVFEAESALIATTRGPDHVFELVNPGYREAAEGRDLVGKTVREAFPELAEPEWFEALDEVYRAGETSRRFDSPIQLGTSDADDEGKATRFATFTYSPRRRDGEVVGVLMFGTDVTEKVAAQRKARLSEDLLSRVFSTIGEGLMLTDGEGTFQFVNPAAASILGREPEEIEGTAYNADSWGITAPDGGPCPDRDLPVARVLDSGEAVQEVELAVERPDGSQIILSVNAAPIERSDGEVGVVTSLRDITGQKQFETQLEYRALHDYLTGLPNRALLRDRLEHAIRRFQRTGETLAVLFFDLDRFKSINDSLGHEIGDRVLEEIARRLRANVRDRDTVARIGGDEFVVLLEDADGEEAVQKTADRLVDAIVAPIHLDEERIQVDVSVGIALRKTDPQDPDKEESSPAEEGTRLIRMSDRAMLRVKGIAGQRIAMAAADEVEHLKEEFARDMRLRVAIQEGRLYTVYQPVFDLESGRPIGVEALARWNDPELGEVSPGQFIPIAEETGLIVSLGEQQMERACQEATAWSALQGSLSDFRVHVNLSARQLSDPRLLQRVQGVLERTQFPAANLHLEITESAAMHEAHKVDELKELGVSLAVDDFGTRYSTLAQVKRLNVDSLKIDRSFVQTLVEDERDRAIVDAILTLGRAMNLGVIAEGIETEEQLRILRAMGCDEGQGFGLAEPMSSDELSAWLKGQPRI